MLMTVKVWDPASWELSAPIEVSVPKSATLHRFGEEISRVTGIDMDNLSVCRVNYTWNFIRGDLVKEAWYRMKDSRFILSGNPWFISLDGLLFIAKDATVDVAELTEE
jgi:hypothetical protein